LARLVEEGSVSRRRISSIWRHEVAERRHLPARLPDASEAVRLVLGREPAARLRWAEAKGGRNGYAWMVAAEGRTWRVAFDTAGISRIL